MDSIESLLDPLRRLHLEVRDAVFEACENRSSSELDQVVDNTGGDAIYGIDRVAEQALVAGLAREFTARASILVVGEGLPSGRITLPASATPQDAHWQLIFDPIDGTRPLMYQKRPGWILTGVAANRSDATSLADIELAVQTEIPLLKQHLCDQLWAVRGQGAHAVRINRLTGESRPLALQPSTAASIRDGFATVCRFFPGGRDVLAALDNELCQRLVGPRTPGDAPVFEDQCGSTAGQLYGLAMGQDRFVADLRPLVWPIVAARGEAPGHCCHPYDICTKLIAEEAGVIVTAPDGAPLEAPLDTEANVAWVGYANRPLQATIQPVLSELLRNWASR